MCSNPVPVVTVTDDRWNSQSTPSAVPQSDIRIVCQICLLPYPLGDMLFCTAQGPEHPRLQCSFCVRNHTIDSYVCSSCSTVSTPSSAHKQSYSCHKCFVCPICDVRLNIHQDCITAQYQHICPFCSWSWSNKAQSPDELLGYCVDAMTAVGQDQQNILQALSSVHPRLEFSDDDGQAIIDVDNDQRNTVERLWDSNKDSLLISSCEPDLLPKYFPLFPRISTRCYTCTRYLIKPNADPRSAGFDKNTVALSTLPVMSVIGSDPIILRFENRSPYSCSITTNSQCITLVPLLRIRQRHYVRQNVSEPSDVNSDWESEVPLSCSDLSHSEQGCAFIPVSFLLHECNIEAVSLMICVNLANQTIVLP
uniref:Dynactin subunit 4 n=1 Tax=Spongospora subterranea TaxID=70186 RepID=A0A0H5R8S8_9EUKA|eukprot:CRZ10122.1 hypothetical protein [Spongospora subterranea]